MNADLKFYIQKCFGKVHILGHQKREGIGSFGSPSYFTRIKLNMGRIGKGRVDSVKIYFFDNVICECAFYSMAAEAVVTHGDINIVG